MVVGRMANTVLIKSPNKTGLNGRGRGGEDDYLLQSTEMHLLIIKNI